MPRQRARRPWEEDGDCHSQQTCRRIRTIHHHEQEMSISPHAPEALIHWHILLWDFLRRVLASVIFVDHEEWLDLTAIGFWQAEKSKGTVADGDVFEVKDIG